MVDGDGVASRAASVLVTARLSSPSRTRSRTSRARLLKDLMGGGESRFGRVVCLILWEMGVVSNIIGGAQECIETFVEEGPHTGFKGISGEVARGSNPTSTSSSHKFGGVRGVNSLMEGRKE